MDRFETTVDDDGIASSHEIGGLIYRKSSVTENGITSTIWEDAIQGVYQPESFKALIVEALETKRFPKRDVRLLELYVRHGCASEGFTYYPLSYLYLEKDVIEQLRNDGVDVPTVKWVRKRTNRLLAFLRKAEESLAA
tara:strand:- start:1829 stop:2242 length:414 start_codon:yes stop_codon:yes gene_type:complete